MKVAYLVRLQDGGFLALYRKCTPGCAVPWMPPRACSSAVPCFRFDAAGAVKSARAAPLDLFQVIIENDVVKVDTGTSIQRDRFEPSQVVYA
jgi:hypothetical protein